MKNRTNNNPPSLGLIGCGYWGKNLARVFNELGTLHTICESAKDKHQQLQDQYPGVQLTDSVDQLWSNPEILQVAIAAPAIHHFELARLALLADKDVFVEKPLCLDLADANKLKDLAEERGKMLMVGHLLQYHPVVVTLQNMVREGAFGKLLRITSNRLNLGKVRTEENAFWSLAPHDVSVILSLVGIAQPMEIRSFEETYLQEDISDCSITRIRFSSGVSAQIQSTWLNPFKEQRLTVVGEDAMAVFDDTEDWPRKLLVIRNYFNEGTPDYIPIEQQEPLRNECLHFMEACCQRFPPKTDTTEGIRVLQILEAATKSAKSNGACINFPAED